MYKFTKVMDKRYQKKKKKTLNKLPSQTAMNICFFGSACSCWCALQRHACERTETGDVSFL